MPAVCVAIVMLLYMYIPVHPDTGVPSCGLLRENWNEDCTLQSLLLVLQVQCACIQWTISI